MDKSEKLRKITEESQKVFFAESKMKFIEVIESLLIYRLSLDNGEKHNIKRFFHSIKGTGATLGLHEISKIGKTYEDLIEMVDNKSDTTHKFYSEMLEGIALAQQEISRTSILLFGNDSDANDLMLDDVSQNVLYQYAFTMDKILLVDDDAAILEHVHKILENEGYQIMKTNNPNAVYDLIQTYQPDIAIFDVMMPEMTGFELLASLRNRGVDLPVIFLTSEATDENKLTGLETGAEDYILKPFLPPELIARVNRTIKKHLETKQEYYVDELTRAFSFPLFEKNFAIAKKRYKELIEPFCIALLDLDCFQNVNTSYSSAVGDYILRLFVMKLNGHLRATDQVYRLQEDKFLVLFPDSTIEKAYGLFENARKEIKSKYFFKDGMGPIEVSFTGSMTKMLFSFEKQNELLDELKICLKQTKESGNAKIVVVKKDENKKNPDLQEKASKGKILVIDDVNSIIQLIKSHFVDIGYEVAGATDGDSGILKLSIFKPDIVILDLMMPKTNGFEVCRAIKARSDMKNTKIIIITAHCQKDFVAKSLEIGVDGYILKPLNMVDLEKRVEKYMSQKPVNESLMIATPYRKNSF